MGPSDVVAGRFVVELPFRSGGMGTVYRGLDRDTGRPVAIKLMHGRGRRVAALAERMGREARALAELEHPAIVRYVAHGTTVTGEPYLVMEWLAGEDLASRLRRGPLAVDETIALGLRAASALSCAHVRGIVHRDIKPTNLFLVDGLAGRAVVLDFGIAHLGQVMVPITGPGDALGTPGYMAPEQARGDWQAEPRVDVFALGCVLYACLAGRPAFAGGHPLAVLAKLLLEDPPPLDEIRNDLPGPLAGIVRRMMSKDPRARPADAGQVSAELSAVGFTAGSGPAAEVLSERPIEVMGRDELHVVSVVLATPAVATRLSAPWEEDSEATLVSRPPSAETRMLQSCAAPFGGRLEVLGNGSVAVSVPAGGTATDLAVRAARCALALRFELPSAPMAVATGRGTFRDRVPVGAAIEAAAEILRNAEGLDTEASARGDRLPVRLDRTTAGLLDARFAIGGDGASLCLVGERDEPSASRTLLGRRTPFVGRDPVLRNLVSTFDDTISQSTAQAVLVTAEAGVGKSRLGRELCERLLARADRPQVWIGRGDPLRAGSPFGLLSDAVRREVGFRHGDSASVRRQQLLARVGRVIDPEESERVGHFLGEMVGVCFPETESVQLRAARKDSVLMGDQMRRAWEDWIAAESRAKPVLLILEDLHWGDLPSIRFIDSALRNVRGSPWMVVGLARPEVHSLFPGLWAQRPLTQLHLQGLAPQAGMQLVTAVLGDSLPQSTAERIVTLSAGNAFFLEELIRSTDTGSSEAPPETVLSMVSSRLEALPAEARRMLRAASTFGRTFWLAGVQALLDWNEQDARSIANALIDEELLEPGGRSRFAGTIELGFRHDLVRQAAYAMLTAEDRARAHRLAAAWLEQAGEREAIILAQHSERGHDRERAGYWYGRAVAQALEASDLSAVIERGELAVGCGVSGERLGAVRLAQSEAHRWKGEIAEGVRRARDALALLPREGVERLAAIAEAAQSSGRLGDTPALLSLAAELDETDLPDFPEAYLSTCARVAVSLFYVGELAAGGPLIRRIEEALSAGRVEDPSTRAKLLASVATRAMFDGDVGRCLHCFAQAVDHYMQAGDLRGGCALRVNSGYANLLVGDYARAEGALRAALETAERIGLAHVAATAVHNLGLAACRLGRLDEALEVEQRALGLFVELGDPRMEGLARIYLAEIHGRRGDLPAAEGEARAALRVLGRNPPARALALATLGRAILAQGRAAEALEHAREASDLVATLGGVEEGEPFVRLVYAEALDATGDHAGARAAIAEARERLLGSAARIADGSAREAFLGAVEDNARTLELARLWG